MTSFWDINRRQKKRRCTDVLAGNLVNLEPAAQLVREAETRKYSRDEDETPPRHSRSSSPGGSRLVHKVSENLAGPGLTQRQVSHL